MNKCLQKTEIPEWMTKGKTILIQKDFLKGAAPTNDRHITCLPMAWKIVTAQIRQIYYSLINHRIFLDEQKGCRKRTRGNHIISECWKLAQNEYKTRHDWLGIVIHWELSEKFKFDHTNKWYMHNPESVLENEAHKLLWDFEIQTDHLISYKWPDFIIMNKKRQVAGLWTLLSRRTTKYNWKDAKWGISTWTLLGSWKKTVEHESDHYTNCNLCSWYSYQRICTRTGGLGNNGTGRNNPNYSIVEIGQNIEKIPGDLRRLAVSHIPVKKKKKKKNTSVSLCERLSRSKMKIIIIIRTNTSGIFKYNRPDLGIVKMKNRELAELWVCCPGCPQSEIKQKRKEG